MRLDSCVHEDMWLAIIMLLQIIVLGDKLLMKSISTSHEQRL